MLVTIPTVLDAEHLTALSTRLADSTWIDGRATAGYQSAHAKRNLQVPQGDVAGREAADLIVRALKRNALFVSATLPRHVLPPLFNRYETGMAFDAHVDNAIRQVPETHHRLRTDISATLFLNPPSEYDGGELIVEDVFGLHSVKLAAGDMVVYPASSVHRVQQVTRGVRIAAFFWIQSMVRDDQARAILFELDTAVRQLTATEADHNSVVRLTACYHNLLRRWAEL
jgi:PKHD-type hydroxylase